MASSVSAQGAQVTVATPANNVPNNQASLADVKIKEIQNAIELREAKTEQKIKALEALILEQKGIIDDLKIDLKPVLDKPLTNGTTFEVWSGIALGVAAIVLTGVAVVVGIGSFWGYREIKDGANRSAKETAKRVVGKLVPLAVAESTEEEVFRLIDNGKLDTVVDEIMQKIIYKDVGFEDDLFEE